MGKRIIITEEQLEKIVSVVNEQKFDDAFTKYQEDKKKKVSLSQDDAALLLNLAQSWCTDKRDHPDCEEVFRLRAQIGMYN